MKHPKPKKASQETIISSKPTADSVTRSTCFVFPRRYCLKIWMRPQKLVFAFFRANFISSACPRPLNVPLWLTDKNKAYILNEDRVCSLSIGRGDIKSHPQWIFILHLRNIYFFHQRHQQLLPSVTPIV